MRTSASWVMVTWRPPVPLPREDGQTDTGENITFPKLRRQAVIMTWSCNRAVSVSVLYLLRK